jgi:hypothetical protein
MKNNRPKSTTARDEKHPQHWWDLGYENALDTIRFYDEKLDSLQNHPLRTSTNYNKGWMEARDDMESVLEIVHSCIDGGRPEFGQLIIEHYINCKGKKA